MVNEIPVWISPDEEASIVMITHEKPTNEMVRRLIPLLEQEDRGGSF
jgi:hypothetical protein